MELPEPLPAFLGTVAQVVFTLAGLLFVAIAGDGEIRTFWFGDRNRSSFAYLSLMLLLLPGFVAVSSLIPPVFQADVPAWPVASFALGGMYLILGITGLILMRNPEYRAEYSRLERGVITNPIREIFIFSIFLLGIGIYAFGAYKIGDPKLIRLTIIMMGTGLVTMIVGGVINAAVFFRAERFLAKNQHSNIAVEVKGSFVNQNATPSTNQHSVVRGLAAILAVMIVGAVISMITGRSKPAQ